MPASSSRSTKPRPDEVGPPLDSQPSARDDRARPSREDPGSRNAADVVVEIPTLGDIRFYRKTQTMVASCRCPEHQAAFSEAGLPVSCSRKRTVRPAAKLAKAVEKRNGQGRPLGHLMAWLESAHEATDQAQHVQQGTAASGRFFSRAERQAARARFAVLPNSARLMELERDRQDWESDDEPRIIS